MTRYHIIAGQLLSVQAFLRAIISTSPASPELIAEVILELERQKAHLTGMRISDEDLTAIDQAMGEFALDTLPELRSKPE